MRRTMLVVSAVAALALAPGAAAFHHGALPATTCHAEAAGSPSNDNGQAKEALLAHHPQGLPLAPVGTAGQPHLMAAPAHENCANTQAD